MVSLPSHGLAIAWKLMVHNSDDFCNSICPKTLKSKLFVLRVVYLCVAHLFTMIMKAENIDINS